MICLVLFTEFDMNLLKFQGEKGVKKTLTDKKFLRLYPVEVERGKTFLSAPLKLLIVFTCQIH